MDLKKYSILRERIYEQNFETKNKDVDKWLFKFSYLGNIGSVFFAYFLLFPALLKTISANLVSGEIASYIAGFFTIIILSSFELLKRKVFGNFIFDFIKLKYKISKQTFGWLLFSLLFIISSFYFSLNGAIDFAKTSGQKNIIVENNINKIIDSTINIYNKRKQELLDDNKQYRESNALYREKIANSPINYRTVRLEYQEMINENQKAIDENEKRIRNIDHELNSKITELKGQLKEQIIKNETDDISNIYLFLLISTSIELIIIIGVYFRKYFEYNVFFDSMTQMEEFFKKRDRYKTLIRFIYKEGNVGVDEPIIGKSSLLKLISDNTKLSNPNKFVDNFLSDMEYLGIIKLVGKRRYTAVSFIDALDKIDNFDDTLRLLENLK